MQVCATNAPPRRFLNQSPTFFLCAYTEEPQLRLNCKMSHPALKPPSVETSHTSMAEQAQRPLSKLLHISVPARVGESADVQQLRDTVHMKRAGGGVKWVHAF